MGTARLVFLIVAASTLVLPVGSAFADGEVSSCSGPLAPLPTVHAEDTVGQEDERIPLVIAVEADPGRVGGRIRLTGLPDGARLSAGGQHDGGWLVSTGELDGLGLFPPENFHGELVLAVEAVRQGCEETLGPISFGVNVTPVADAPVLLVRDAVGREDEPVGLSVTAKPTGPQESISVAILDVPEGFSFSHGELVGAEWQIAPDDLGALQIVPPMDFSGRHHLRVSVTAEDAGDSVLVARGFDVEVKPVADTPSLNVVASQAREDEPIALRIDASTADESEKLSLRISGLPPGASLSGDTEQVDGIWRLTPAQTEDLQLTLPMHFNGPFPLNVIATSRDGEDRASEVATVRIEVAAEADSPEILLGNLEGTEDAPIELGALVRVADAKQDTQVDFLGLPPGAVISRGSPLGQDGWRLGSLADLEDLHLTLPPEYAGQSDIRVVATTRDGDSVAEAAAEIELSVAARADPAVLRVRDVSVLEDEGIPLSVGVEKRPRESLRIELSGLPESARLSAGERLEGGVWQLAGDDLAGLSIIPAPNYAGNLALELTAVTEDQDDRAVVTVPLMVEVAAVADQPALTVIDQLGEEDQPIPLGLVAESKDAAEFLTIRIAGVPADASLSAGRRVEDAWHVLPEDLTELALIPPPHFSGQIELGVQATTYHGQSQAAQRGALLVTVDAVADVPLLDLSPVSGVEDTRIPLVIEASLADPSEQLSLALLNVPEGSALSRGEPIGGGQWLLAPGDWPDVEWFPPAHFSGTAELVASATAVDGDDTETAVGTIVVTVEPVADPPTITAEDAIGIEDGMIALQAQAGTPDPSETLTVRVAGLPQGARMSAGRSGAEGEWLLNSEDLRDLSIIPPANFSGRMVLELSALSVDGESVEEATTSIGVSVVPVADFPALTLVPAIGLVGQPLALDLDVAAADEGETVDITLRGLPTGFGLSKGRELGDGAWMLSLSDLKDLTLIPADNAESSFEIVVSVLATDGSDRKQVSEALPVAFREELPADGASLSLLGSATAAENAVGLGPDGARSADVLEAETTEPTVTASDDRPIQGSQSDETDEGTAEIAPAAEVSTAAGLASDGGTPQTSEATEKMLARAEDYMRVGDVTAARLLFVAVAKSGNGAAALRVGETYDPVFLGAGGVVGVLPDPRRASRWYKEALDLGVAEAAERIERLDVSEGAE